MKENINVIEEPPYTETPPIEIPLSGGTVKKDVKTTRDIKSIILTSIQGDEGEFQELLLDFMVKEQPKIIFTHTWTIGISVYLLIIYR